MDGQLKVTVISDLHCKHTSADKDANGKLLYSTNLYSDLLRKDAAPRHPVFSLLQLIEDNKGDFKSDLLLCPGDITDKIDEQGYISGWSFLEELREATDSEELYATVGNHDVDSRRGNPDNEPFTIAKAIKNNYPVKNEDLRNQFWQKNFCLAEGDNYVLLIFNSAHSHISYDDAKKSKIDRATINQMENKLKTMDKDKIRIAMCHHHPLNHANLTASDDDVIQNGTDFLDMLNRQDFTILIHGHKHEMKIRYYGNLVVFCSGSFSSTDNLKDTESENAFHQIRFINKSQGLINTYYYGSHNGWHQKYSNKFPPVSGFGTTGKEANLAQQVSDWLKKKSNGFNELYNKVATDIPEITFLIPSDMKKFKEELRSEYQIDITYDDYGIPKLISKIQL